MRAARSRSVEKAEAVYDAGILIAAEKNERWAWAEHQVRLAAGVVPVVPAAVVAQVSRSPRQVQLRRFLKGCEVVSLTEDGAHRAGALLGAAKTSDVVDASLVALAITRGAEVVTTDASDIAALVAASGRRVRVATR